MDRDRKDELAALLLGLPATVLVATHDPEFVAAFADLVRRFDTSTDGRARIQSAYFLISIGR